MYLIYTFKLMNQIYTVNNPNSWICRCDGNLWWTTWSKLFR